MKMLVAIFTSWNEGGCLKWLEFWLLVAFNQQRPQSEDKFVQQTKFTVLFEVLFDMNCAQVDFTSKILTADAWPDLKFE